LRHSQEEVQRYSGRLANLRQDLTVCQDTSGDKFSIELDGNVLDNRGVAGELIMRQAAKIRTAFGATARIGKFAGFELSLRASYNGEVELFLHGKGSYTARVTDTALGTIRSLESIPQGFGERVIRLESDIQEWQKRANEFEVKVGAPFEREQRYHQLAKRQSEIEEALDLTKNQASSQIEVEENGVNPEDNSQQQTKTKPDRQTRKATVGV
jgi:hypothetical protein